MEHDGNYLKSNVIFGHWIYCVPLVFFILLVPFNAWNQVGEGEFNMIWILILYPVFVIPYCLHLTRWFVFDQSGITLHTVLGKNIHYAWYEIDYVELNFDHYTMQSKKKKQFATIYNKQEDWMPVKLYMQAPELKTDAACLAVQKADFLALMQRKSIEVRVNEGAV